MSRKTRLASIGHRLALGGLYLFAGCAFLVENAAGIGLYILGLGVLFQTRAFVHNMYREPLVWAGLAFLAAITLVAHSSIPLRPDSASFQWSHYRDWLRLWVFIPIAWVIGNNQRRRLWLVSLAAAGFVLGRLFEVNATYLTTAWNGLRSELGYPANGLGLYSAILLTGLILLNHTIRGLPGRTCSVWSWRYFAWLALLLMCLQFVMSSQARGAWLALFLIVPVLYVLAASPPRDLDAANRKSFRLSTFLALACMLALLGLNHKNIAPRIQLQADSYQDFVAQKYTASATGSLARRVHMNQFGLQKWREKPVLGWGAGASRVLNKSDPVIADRPHLHNGYVEILLQFGLFGFAIWLCVFLRLFRATYARQIKESSSIQLRQATTLGLVLLALGWLSDYLIHFQEWRYCWLLLAGIALSYSDGLQGRNPAA